MIDAVELLSILGPITCCEENLGICLPHEHILHSISSILNADDKAEAGADNIQVEELLSARQDPKGYRKGINLRMENTSDSIRELERMKRDLDVVIIDATLDQERLNSAVMSNKVIDIAEKLVDKRIHIVNVTSLNLEQVEFESKEESSKLFKIMKHRFLYGEKCENDSGSSRKRYFGAMYQQLHLSFSTEGINSSTLDRKHQFLASTIAKLHSEINVPVFLSLSCNSNQTIEFFAYVQSFFHQMQIEGVKMDRIVFCHADRWIEQPHFEYTSFLFSLADLGVSLLLSSIGLYTASEYLILNPLLTLGNDTIPKATWFTPPKDQKIVQLLYQLIARGYVDQVLISTSILLKTQLRRYGGGGYQYLEQCFKKGFLAGSSDVCEMEKWWQTMTRRNPLKLLKWYSAPSKAETPREYLICSICKQCFEPIVGEFFTKFNFTYCGTKCLKLHSKCRFKAIK